MRRGSRKLIMTPEGVAAPARKPSRDETLVKALVRAHRLVDRLFGIAEVVRRDQLDLLTEHAAAGIEVGQRLRGAALELLAEPGDRTSYRAGPCRSEHRPPRSWRQMPQSK
jgi:hypothetical protein